MVIKPMKMLNGYYKIQNEKNQEVIYTKTYNIVYFEFKKLAENFCNYIKKNGIPENMKLN